MVRLRDGFVSGLPLITLPDRQFDRPISDGPSMAWAETTRAQKLVGSVDRLAPPTCRQSQGDQRCATQINVL